jgi:hypothetical protein
MERAAQLLIERHGSLRAGFEHANLPRPVQVIAAGVRPPWRDFDLTSLDAAQREARLTEFLAQDRVARFDLTTPPLLRFALVRVGEEEHRLVLTSHHLLIDGWSAAILVQELLALYASRGNAAVLPVARPYRDYLAWVAAQDHAGAMSAWREALAGLQEPTRVAPHERSNARTPPEQMILARRSDPQHDDPNRLGHSARTFAWPR